VAENGDYRVLLLTSDPGTIDEVTDVGRRNFEHVTVVFWEMGNTATKPDVLRQIEETDYNLIVSYINGIILKRHHLETAHFGAVNIHPAPPEHPGAWGIWCQPVICREVRTHHGTTVHEMDEDIDHGPIYRVDRWEVSEDATIQSVVERSFGDCLPVLENVAEELGRSPNGTGCFQQIDERWHPTNRHHTVEDVRAWFAALDPAHPAHQERIPLNHPRATMSPPYFDDV
jgi:folate-dependent phosphoribosylglycinamide formyltransferase PurN